MVLYNTVSSPDASIPMSAKSTKTKKQRTIELKLWEEYKLGLTPTVTQT